MLYSLVGDIMTSFIIRLAILLFPGIVGLKVYKQLTFRRTKKDWEEFGSILAFSIGSYLIWSLLGRLFCRSMFVFTNFSFLYNESVEIEALHVGAATLIGCCLAIISCYAFNKKLLNRFVQKIGFTKRYGDEDLWDYFHNDINPEWLVIRDHKLDLVYFGNIAVFSESEMQRELILYDVRVFDIKSNPLYEVKKLYICREDTDISIEIHEYEKEGCLHE